MSYTIQWSSELNNDTNPTPASIGKSIITIVDNSTDTTSTSLTLTGRGLSGYGAFQQENFIRLMENFASEYAPISPTVGQQWFDTTTNTLSVYVQTTSSPAAYAWESVYPVTLPPSIPVISATTPASPEVGLIWYNTATNVISIYTGTNTIAGAPSPSGQWTPFFNASSTTVNSLTGAANQIALNGSSGNVTISLASNVVLTAPTTGVSLTVSGQSSSSSALIVNGPLNNTTPGTVLYSGDVTAANQISSVLYLQQSEGSAYGGNGAALMLGAINNNNNGPSGAPIAGAWAYLTGGGSGGNTDHFGSLVLGTKAAGNSTGPVARVVVDYAYNMYPAITNTGACGVPSARWSAVYAAQVYADVLNGGGGGIGAGTIPTTSLAYYTINVTAGTGLSGGGTASLGTSITLANAGVTSIGAGNGISISSSGAGGTGGVTITNSGVRALQAGGGIGVSSTTGTVTVSNSGVTSFNSRTGGVTLSSSDVTGALGFTPASLAQLAAVASATAGTNGKLVIGAVTVIWGVTTNTFPGSANGTITFWTNFSSTAYICIPIIYGQSAGNFAPSIGIVSLAPGSAVVSVNAYSGANCTLKYIAIGPT